MKSGSIDTILSKHQASCQACNDCKYKCVGSPKVPCECGEFYTTEEMKEHLLAKEKQEAERKQKEEIIRQTIISLFNRSWRTIEGEMKKGIRSKSMAQPDVDDLVF